MDFFQRQEASRKATRGLVVLFGLAFVAVGIASAAALFLGLGIAGSGQLISTNPILMAQVVAVVVGMMVIASLFRSATLSQGGGHVARMLGGTQIQMDDRDPVHRRLINVVEEMSIASGVPVPEIYVLEGERGINAFAAGLSTDDAAVAVTRGSLEQLSRAELQGVIAHEFSHILNGDMRLNLRLMGFSFGILVLSLIGRWLLRASTRGIRVNRRGGSPALMIGVALTVIGAIGVLLSRLIKAAVSRRREVLADASAVQFTREPMALAGALKKIGGFTPFIEKAEVEEVSHMMFGRAGKSFSGLFATHPPLDERIRALDPQFKPGDYQPPSTRAPADIDTDSAAAGFSSFDSGASFNSEDVSDSGGIDINPDSAGSINPIAGMALREAIPDEVADAAHSTQSSWLLVLALGLARGGGTVDEQRLLESQLGEKRARRCLALREELDRMPAELLLPILELTVPALKARPAEQLDYLFELLQKLAAADGEVTLFEYLLQRSLKAHLTYATAGRAGREQRRHAALILLASFARHGSRDDSAAAALAAGVKALGLPGTDSGTDIEAIIREAGPTQSFDALDQALDRLQDAPPMERRNILMALAVTMRHDRTVTIEEAEMFRTLAAVLGCPVPPAHRIS